MTFVQEDEDNSKIPVALCIKEKNLYLSCVMKDGKPTLQLEVSEYQGLKAPQGSSQTPLGLTHFQDNDPFPAQEIWE